MNEIIKCVIIFTIIIAIVVIIIFGINFYVKFTTKKQIIENTNYSNINDIDCIIVLGAGIWGNKPSPMLEDRLLTAVDLYYNNVSTKIIMSGDHSRKDYNEVYIMKNRAKEIFGVKKAIIVTQKYHLYRALYIANKFGIEAYGVGSDPRKYVGETYREAREILARNKDFIKCIFKPKPKYLGESIPVSGDGDITNDK